MNCTFDLAGAIDALVRIRDAGWLSDLECEIAEATRGPRYDLERWPHYRLAVDEMTRLLVRLTGLSHGVCCDAACQCLLPSTRRRIAVEIIREFDARLAEANQSGAAGARLERERARMGPA